MAHISQTRQALLYGTPSGSIEAANVANWIQRSWLRSLADGHRPERTPTFDSLAPELLKRTLEGNRPLIDAARLVLESLGRAIVGTRYFAILTNQHGVVVDVSGAIDRTDRRADLITRIGTNLSERQLATTTIGAALAELEPVWLHRGEHFFESNSIYSCAGAPIFGPDGTCIGTLDLTGIEAAERPELKHLVAQSACSIENALTLARLSERRGLLLRLNWPGRALGDETDGLICVDTDGFICGANQMARKMVPQLGVRAATPQHCSDLFAMAFEMLFDAAMHPAGTANAALEIPLWTGLRLHALAMPMRHAEAATSMRRPARADTSTQQPLKDIETALIRQAVEDARGNVQKAAKALGVSRATVYRRLGSTLRQR